MKNVGNVHSIVRFEVFMA